MRVNLSAPPNRTPSEVSAFVANQLAHFRDSEAAKTLQPFLVAPRRELRVWEWSEVPLEFPVWVVAEHPRYNYALVYSDNGFGPEQPWGLVFSSARNFGADYSWYAALEDAFKESRFLESDRTERHEA
jgi:hypothetical protein